MLDKTLIIDFNSKINYINDFNKYCDITSNINNVNIKDYKLIIILGKNDLLEDNLDTSNDTFIINIDDNINNKFNCLIYSNNNAETNNIIQTLLKSIYEPGNITIDIYNIIDIFSKSKEWHYERILDKNSEYKNANNIFTLITMKDNYSLYDVENIITNIKNESNAENILFGNICDINLKNNIEMDLFYGN